jgi:hypothetical protein
MPSIRGDRVRPLFGDPERGDVVLGWFTKVAGVIAVLGVIGFDGISVLTTRLAVEDDAGTAARAASETWQARHDVQASLLMAQETAASQDPANIVDPKGFLIDADGTAHVTIRREAATLVIRHVGPARHWAQVHARVAGRSTA